jgi:hypothetical protein
MSKQNHFQNQDGFGEEGDVIIRGIITRILILRANQGAQ